jgi:hypothetical protein
MQGPTPQSGPCFHLDEDLAGAVVPDSRCSGLAAKLSLRARPVRGGAGLVPRIPPGRSRVGPVVWPKHSVFAELLRPMERACIRARRTAPAPFRHSRRCCAPCLFMNKCRGAGLWVQEVAGDYLTKLPRSKLCSLTTAWVFASNRRSMPCFWPASNGVSRTGLPVAASYSI